VTRLQFLSPPEHRTLAAFCETLLPRLPADAGDDADLMKTSADDVDLARAVEDALAHATDAGVQAQLKQFLALLETRVFGGIVAGRWSPFTSLPVDARTQILYALATHRLAVLRKGFSSITRLSLSLFYSLLADGETNPAHAAFNYRLPPRPVPPRDRPIKPLDVSACSALHCDVLIVGSGAGGGVVAGELTAAGHDVLVVEKGGYFYDSDFDGRELDGQKRLFEKRGTLTTADGGLLILAGSTLGGGTTINWSGSLRPPDFLLQDWERAYGFEGVAGPEFQRSLDAVSLRMGIDATRDDEPSVNTRVFEAGLTALGRRVTRIPSNTRNCGDCGFCSFGCPHGAKQGTLKTYLQDAHDRGARIVVNAEVEKILHSYGAVHGARVRARDCDGTVRELDVKCKAVILAAGAIHTPAVLLRSDVRNPNLGRHLRLHPTTATSAVFEEPIRAWQGAPMTRLTADFADLDSRGYGVRLMNAPTHPGMLAFATPWTSGRQHKRVMQQSEHTANIIVITRDRHSGRITLDRAGRPVVHYALHPYDARHMMKGIQEAVRIHVAAGARSVHTAQSTRPTYRPDTDGGLDDFLKNVERLGLRPHDFPVFSAHQMSSARIAGSAKQGVADPNGETYGVKRLFLADGSVLPTCSGVNPMLTILGTAHYLTQRIKARL
jgi:choline dehydrogenase-like flavoprotein